MSHLAAYDQGTSPASATVVRDDEIEIYAVALPRLSAGNYYEVWLTDPDRTVTIPVGALGRGATGDFQVASELIHRYSAIEVSVQTPAQASYSGVSVLRGTYR